MKTTFVSSEREGRRLRGSSKQRHCEYCDRFALTSKEAPTMITKIIMELNEAGSFVTRRIGPTNEKAIVNTVSSNRDNAKIIIMINIDFPESNTFIGHISPVTLKVAEGGNISVVFPNGPQEITEGNDVKEYFTEADSASFDRIVKGERILAAMIDSENKTIVQLRNEQHEIGDWFEKLLHTSRFEHFLKAETIVIFTNEIKIEQRPKVNAKKMGRPRKLWYYNFFDGIPTCPVCGNRFSTGSVAIWHLRHHHPDEYNRRTPKASKKMIFFARSRD